MIFVVVVASIAAFLLGYRFYGRFFARKINLCDSRQTPACTMNDGVDFVPIKPAFLLGQHFSAISAAGPIVGPILAAIWFGWLPAVLWIVLGAIFIGGIHDFSSLVASVRHKAASIGEIVKQHMSPTSHKLFLIFVWLSLIYVIVAFTDITAHTFKIIAEGSSFGPGVAASSALYLVAAVVMGIATYRLRMRLWLATVVFVPVVLLIVWVGPRLPESVLAGFGALSISEWHVVLLIYCFVASVVPMWILLQPRGYLGGWLLYLVIAIGLLGAIFGGFAIQYPALNLSGLTSLANGKLLFPLLFITIACGACSGFHAIVSSGTTSKQLARETDALSIGYGGMLLEGVVAVLALATVMMLPAGSALLKGDPNLVYANGLAQYLGLVGVGFGVAFPFALLAFSTFVYDTLDVCTRLARYIFQELTGFQSRLGGYLAALASLAVPLVFLTLTKEKAYLVAWPIFGTSNQLLASLTLLALSVWFLRTGRRAIFTVLPMLFMMVMTLWSLVMLIIPFVRSLLSTSTLGDGQAQAAGPDVAISGICGIVLLLLSVLLIIDSARTLWKTRRSDVRKQELVGGST